jgi:thiosulfate dehydrogenase [quinone] large subunit
MNKSKVSLSKRVATLRIGFGLVWAIDAAFKFQSVFYKNNNLLNFIKAKDSGEPHWLNFWFHTWYNIIGWNPELFAILIIIAEVLIALFLLLGVARRSTYIFGAILMFIIWGVGEAFGGPYVSGITDINAGFIYVIVFTCLYVMDGLTKPSWSLDQVIEKHLPIWSKLANPPKIK